MKKIGKKLKKKKLKKFDQSWKIWDWKKLNKNGKELKNKNWGEILKKIQQSWKIRRNRGKVEKLKKNMYAVRFNLYVSPNWNDMWLLPIKISWMTFDNTQPFIWDFQGVMGDIVKD